MKDFFDDYGITILVIAGICAILGVTGSFETIIQNGYEEVSTAIQKYTEKTETEREYWQKKIEMLEVKNDVI